MRSNYPIVLLKNRVKQLSLRNKDNESIDVYSVTNSEGFIKSENFFNKEVFSKDTSNYKIVQRGQFAYNPSRINVGSIDYLRDVENALVSPLYIIFELTDKIHPDYLFKFLKSHWGNIQIRANTEGAVRDSLKFKGLENIKIPLPSLEQQLQITCILTKIEKIIQQRKQSLQQLDDFIKSVFLDMFGDPVSNKKGWQERKIDDLVDDVKYGTSASAKGGKYDYLRMNNITYSGYWDLRDVKSIDIEEKDFDKYSLTKGDVVFNRTNSRELVGKTAVYMQDKPVVIAGYLIRVRVNDENNPWFIWGHLNSQFGKNYLFNLCRNIVGMANINAQELRSIPILSPPLALQNQFATIVEKVEKIKEQYQQSLTELEKLYGAISQKAFKGELDLDKIPLIEVPQTQTQQCFDNIDKELDTQIFTQSKPSLHLYPFLKGVDILTVKGRLELIKFWFEQSLKNTKKGNPLSIEAFWQNAQFNFEQYRDKQLNIAEKNNKSDEVDAINNLNLGIQEYDFLKALIFEKLAEGLLHQELSEVEKLELTQLTHENDLDTKNTIILKK